MPRINLLPWRAELRQKRKKELVIALMGAVIVGASSDLLARYTSVGEESVRWALVGVLVLVGLEVVFSTTYALSLSASGNGADYLLSQSMAALIGAAEKCSFTNALQFRYDDRKQPP